MPLSDANAVFAASSRCQPLVNDVQLGIMELAHLRSVSEIRHS